MDSLEEQLKSRTTFLETLQETVKNFPDQGKALEKTIGSTQELIKALISRMEAIQEREKAAAKGKAQMSAGTSAMTTEEKSDKMIELLFKKVEEMQVVIRNLLIEKKIISDRLDSIEKKINGATRLEFNDEIGGAAGVLSPTRCVVLGGRKVRANNAGYFGTQE